MAYRVDTESRGGRTVCRLHDDATGAAAAILPSYGFNLFSLKLPVAGQVREILHAAPDFAEDPKSPGRNGTPVLFPFPNRINAGRYRFQGKDYQLPLNSRPHAIHGFAIGAPWDVVEHKAGDDGAHLVGRYQISKNTPEMRQFWPTDAVLQIRYNLSGRRLSMTITVSNPSAEELPYGFGIHPYFRLPIVPGGDPDRTRVVLPASSYWVLDGYIPTGEIRPVDDRLDFRKGQPRTHLKLDDVLTGLTLEGDHGVCRLVDQALGAETRLGFDRNFRELVVFTPPADGVIAVEPYTQTTDAINLEGRGIEAGLRRLGHDQQETLSLVMETAG
ncbi:MAG: aldose 1-epimerase [Chloroflexota bacterium]|nr:aldose 1-epimerase [Chloroflexota bacterium]